MKKIFLSIVGFSMLCRVSSYAQTGTDTSTNKAQSSLYAPVTSDDDAYRPRRLRLDEVNLVSSYYNQDGNHSPVTGGIGTEKVMDLSNGLDLKFLWLDQGMNKHSLTAGLGIDYHTSASAAFVNKSGASKTGGSRVYPSLDWTVENSSGKSSFGIGTYLSSEYNYQSFGADLHYSKKTNDKSGEFSAKFQAYLDEVTLIYPSELIPAPTVTTTTVTSASGRTSSSSSSSKNNIPTSPRNTYTGSFSYSQMINSRLQLMLMTDVVKQDGYLSLPFHRVYFEGNTTAAVEKLPSSRFKLPVGMRLNYFLGDNIILRSYYRYYSDDWGTKSNTANLELTYKVTPFFSISPYYRYYDQTAAKYFAPYGAHTAADTYYTSNYAYAQFKSAYFGAGFRIAPPKGVLGWQNLHDMEIRYGHYSQTTGLKSDVVSVAFSFK